MSPFEYSSIASRLAFADRDQYIADPDFVQAPGGHGMSLLEPRYLAERARLIGPVRMTTAVAGTPGVIKTSYAPMPEQPEHGTSHISIVDADGNALAMTSTIENAFGSRQMVKGFLLNNELTDFSFTPRDAQDRPIANRVEPGKRPRSSMAPTLVFDKTTGELLMSGGSPGGGGPGGGGPGGGGPGGGGPGGGSPPTSVPEPAVVLLLAAGVGLIVLFRRSMSN